MAYNAWRVFLSRRQRRAQWSANAARRFFCQETNAESPPLVLCSRARHGALRSLYTADLQRSVHGQDRFCKCNFCFFTPGCPRDWWWHSSKSSFVNRGCSRNIHRRHIHIRAGCLSSSSDAYRADGILTLSKTCLQIHGVL